MSEAIINYIKNLVFHGKTPNEAVDHATHYFGKTRQEILKIMEEHTEKN